MFVDDLLLCNIYKLSLRATDFYLAFFFCLFNELCGVIIVISSSVIWYGDNCHVFYYTSSSEVKLLYIKWCFRVHFRTHCSKSAGKSFWIFQDYSLTSSSGTFLCFTLYNTNISIVFCYLRKVSNIFWDDCC